MSGYVYPTRFESFTDTELNLLFSTDCWGAPVMDLGAKVDACQELENRLADLDGSVPRQIIAEHMDGGTLGVCGESHIILNANVIEDGVIHTLYTDDQGNVKVKEDAITASNWTVYETVCHEHQHAVQYDEGRDQGMAYIRPDTDYELYRIQPDEREAYQKGAERTLAALDSIQRLGYQDPNAQKYLASLQVDSYDSFLAKAQEHFSDPNIQQALDTVLHNYARGVQTSYESPGEIAVEQALERQRNEDLQMMGSQQSVSKQDPGISSPTYGAGNWGRGSGDSLAQTQTYGESELDVSEGRKASLFEGSGWGAFGATKQSHGQDQQHGIDRGR